MIHPDDLERIARTLDRLPERWQDTGTRAAIYHALDTSTLLPDDPERVSAWERVRYLSGFPDTTAAQTPIYSVMRGASTRDPYADGTPPDFDALMAALHYASGWYA